MVPRPRPAGLGLERSPGRRRRRPWRDSSGFVKKSTETAAETWVFCVNFLFATPVEDTYLLSWVINLSLPTLALAETRSLTAATIELTQHLDTPTGYE